MLVYLLAMFGHIRIYIHVHIIGLCLVVLAFMHAEFGVDTISLYCMRRCADYLLLGIWCSSISLRLFIMVD